MTHLDPDAYEVRARSELAAWRAKLLRNPGALGNAARAVQARINAAIPERVHAAVTAVIEQMTRGILSGSGLTTPQPLLDASLAEREALVREKISFYRATAAAEGGIAGAGGFLLAAADFPALITLKIKLLFDIAALYGHDVKSLTERLYILQIFQLAFSSPNHRRAVYAEMIDSLQSPPESLETLDWRRFQQEYRDHIDLAKMAQLLPVVGAPIGAIVNYRLINALGETAMNAYRLRLLGA